MLAVVDHQQQVPPPHRRPRQRRAPTSCDAPPPRGPWPPPRPPSRDLRAEPIRPTRPQPRSGPPDPGRPREPDSLAGPTRADHRDHTVSGQQRLELARTRRPRPTKLVSSTGKRWGTRPSPSAAVRVTSQTIAAAASCIPRLEPDREPVPTPLKVEKGVIVPRPRQWRKPHWQKGAAAASRAVRGEYDDANV